VAFHGRPALSLLCMPYLLPSASLLFLLLGRACLRPVGWVCCYFNGDLKTLLLTTLPIACFVATATRRRVTAAGEHFAGAFLLRGRAAGRFVAGGTAIPWDIPTAVRWNFLAC